MMYTPQPSLSELSLSVPSGLLSVCGLGHYRLSSHGSSELSPVAVNHLVLLECKARPSKMYMVAGLTIFLETDLKKMPPVMTANADYLH